MIHKAIIDNFECYDYCVKRGYQPLIDEKLFTLDINLRKEIQKIKFGGNDNDGNERFYKYCIAHKLMVCEECGKPINHPSAINVSHILSRGSHPEMAHDPRNVNILCPEHHEMWEHSTTREGMRINEKNKKRIERLKTEYNHK